VNSIGVNPVAAEASVPGDLDSRIQSEAHTLIKVAAADSHEHRMLAEILYIRLPLSSFGESRPECARSWPAY